MRKLGKLVAAAIMAICWLSGSSALAQDQIVYPIAPKLITLTETEKLVLERTASGDGVDLLNKYGKDEKKRQIRGKFLKALLTSQFSGFTVHHHGVQIKNAIIPDKLDLKNAKVPFDVSLQDCVFQDAVNFQDALFEKNLNLMNSHFKGEAHFLKMKVAVSAYFNNCSFQGPVNFNGADIGEAFNAEGGRFETEKEIHFSAFKVKSSALFSYARFRGPVSFTKAKFGELQMVKVDFCQDADFLILTVDHDAFFTDARFHGAAKFGGTTIGRDFKAPGVQFLSKDEEKYASFPGLKVGHIANLTNKAVFKGPVDFDNADIALELQADGAEFHHEKGIEAINMKVGSIASFNGALFKGRVSFSGSTIGGQFNAEKAQFMSRDWEADFSGIKVGQLATFSGAVFEGPVTFLGADIGGGELKAEVVKGTEEVELGAKLEGGLYRGRVSLENAHLSDLLIKGSGPSPLTITELKLERANVKRCLSIVNTTLESLKAWNLQGEGQTKLECVHIKDQADLRDSNFLNLKLFNVTWPLDREQTQLAGLTYQAVSAKEAKEVPKDWEKVKEDWEKVKAWIAHSKFDKRNYKQLEDYLQHAGFEDEADGVYIKMKRRELLPDGWWGALNPLVGVKLLFWDFLAGYGRKPWRAFLPSLAFIVLGAIIFKPGLLKPEFLDSWTWLPQLKWVKYTMVRLLISIDLFLPAVDLGLAKELQISNLKFSQLLYFHVHKVAGWILILIGLAAITTKLK